MSDKPVKIRKFIVAECVRASVAPDPKSAMVVLTMSSGSANTETKLLLNEASAMGLYLQKMSNLSSEVDDVKISDDVFLETGQGWPTLRLLIDDTTVAWLMTRVVCAYLGPWVLEVVKEQQVRDAPKPA